MLGCLEVIFFDQPPSVYTVVGDITFFSECDQGFGNWQQPENNVLNWNPVSKIQWSGVRKKVLLLMLTSIHLSLSIALRKKYPNTEFFLVRIFPHSIQMGENKDHKNFHICILFTQCHRLRLEDIYNSLHSRCYRRIWVLKMADARTYLTLFHRHKARIDFLNWKTSITRE